MSQYFPQPYEPSVARNVKVELYLYNYATKAVRKGQQALIHLGWDQKQIWLA